MNTFTLIGLKCQSCVEKISAALYAHSISGASVSLNPPSLKAPKQYSISQIERAIASAGDYQVSLAVEASTFVPPADPVGEEKLTPLFIILGYLFGAVLLRAIYTLSFDPMRMMAEFMGLFFVVFSLFKAINLKGFAEAYATYDILAARSRTYALLYPFIELALGVAYLVEYNPIMLHSVTMALMGIGSIGVYKALRTKRKFQCACLGTALKLPMTKVTLVEDVGMGIMACIMLVHTLLN